MIPHQHALNYMTVRQPKQKFAGAVLTGLLHLNEFQRWQLILLRKPFPQRFGKVRHLLKMIRQLFMHPAIHLLCPKLFLSQPLHLLLEF